MCAVSIAKDNTLKKIINLLDVVLIESDTTFIASEMVKIAENCGKEFKAIRM